MIDREEAEILSDPRRRQRATRLLDMIEQKKTETYHAFLDAMNEQYPHIFLALTDTFDEGDDDDMLPDEIEGGSPCEWARRGRGGGKGGAGRGGRGGARGGQRGRS